MIDDNIQNNNELKKDLKSYFDSISMSESQKYRLEHFLLSAEQSPAKSSLFLKGFFIRRMQRSLVTAIQFFKRPIFAHFSTALLSIMITFAGFKLYRVIFEPHHKDIIAEVADLPDYSSLPADFDLEGDLSALPELANDTLSNRSFLPPSPALLPKNYTASDARFFWLKGHEGVRISMKHTQKNIAVNKPENRFVAGNHENRHAVLYIVKLSEKDFHSFPKQRELRRIASSSGKMKRVYAWREGEYGYAMVQSLSSSPNLEESSQYLP